LGKGAALLGGTWLFENRFGSVLEERGSMGLNVFSADGFSLAREGEGSGSVGIWCGLVGKDLAL
jgi:hypothetical protein